LLGLFELAEIGSVLAFGPGKEAIDGRHLGVLSRGGPVQALQIREL
jgi:hypothetical protein